MPRKFVLLLTVVLWSAMTLPLPNKASAETAITQAVVQSLRNLVRLIPQNKTARPARIADAMIPGDALSTGHSSLAELRFNDGSLARIGEQAVFRFLTKTRNFRLSNGTVLLLIPPGRGITGVQTPNAAAAIRGSALFVRYIPNTRTTIVGALTDSNIEVFNENASERQVLEAGQMAVVVNDRIERLYEFDLNTFYETSDLVQQLNLDKPTTAPNPDPALASVQAETAAAAAAQPPVQGEGVIENPAFVQPPTSTPTNNSTIEKQPVNNSTVDKPANNNTTNNSTSTNQQPANNNTINNSTSTDQQPVDSNMVDKPAIEDNAPGRSQEDTSTGGETTTTPGDSSTGGETTTTPGDGSTGGETTTTSPVDTTPADSTTPTTPVDSAPTAPN